MSDEFDDGFVEMSRKTSSLTADSDFSSRRLQEQEKREEMTTVLKVLLAKSLFSLVFTVTPVMFKTIGSNDLHPEYDGWYRGGDIVRFIEPIGGLLFSFWLFQLSGILKYNGRNMSVDLVVAMVYAFGVSLYVQGGGFHSCSNMFKHGVQIFLDDYIPIDSIDTPEEKDQREYMEDFLYWMRTVWQHIVSHYIYAVGATITDVCILFAYRNHTIKFRLSDSMNYKEEDPSFSPIRSISLSNERKKKAKPRRSKTEEFFFAKSLSHISKLVIANAIIYSLLLGGVAINFPSGIIVAFIYFPIFLFVVCRFIYVSGDIELCKKEEWRVLIATRPVPNAFILSYVLALIILLLWIAVVGGLKKRSDAM